MEKYYSRNSVCVTCIFQLCLLFGYFGVSDTDTDVLLPLGVNVNFPAASPTTYSSSSRSVNNGKSKEDVNTSNNKLRMKRTSDDDGIPHDEEMRLWDQIFSNALATSNTSQWMHLRQIFDRVEEELHKTKSTGNGSLNQIHKIHPSLELPHQTTPFVGPLLLPKTTLGISKHPKFSYHRVSGLRGRGRPFAAVTLAIADSTEGDTISSKTVKTERVSSNADHTFSRDFKNEEKPFSLDADYQLDGSQGREHETLLNNDFKHFKNFDHSDTVDSSPTSSHLSNKFETFQNFESFSGADVSEMGVSGHDRGDYDEASRVVSTSNPWHLYHHLLRQEHKERHRHHHHGKTHKKNNFPHHHENDDNVNGNHHSRRRKVHHEHHSDTHEYQWDK